MFSGLSRHSGMRVNSALSTALTTSSGRIVGVDRHHLGAVDHHVGHFEVAEAEDILDVFGLAHLHLAVLGRFLDQPLDLDVGEDFLLRAFLDAQHPQDRARGGVEQPVQRIEQQKRDVERIRDPLRHRHRLPDRQRLRHLLADHDMQRGEHQEADQERREVQCRFRHSERDQNRVQQRRNRRLADPAEAERGHGDAELATGEIGLDVAQHLLQQAGAEAVFLRHRVDAEAPALDQREFRGNVKRVGGQQEEGEQQIDDRVGHRRAIMRTSFSARKARTSAASTSRVTKACADAAHQDERQPAALDLLVLGDQVHHRIDAGPIAAGTALTWVGSPTAARWRDGAVGLGLRDQPAPGGELERQRHAEPDRLAVQQPVGKAGRGLERMSEGVAEVEQHAVAGLALVARDDRGLGLHAFQNGIFARRRRLPRAGPPANTSRQLASSHSKKCSVAKQPVFHHLGVAGAEFALRQRIEQRGVGDHQDRLIERADQVLALAGVDRGLAADRGIDLRQAAWSAPARNRRRAAPPRRRSPRDRRPRRRRAQRPDRRARSWRRSAHRRPARRQRKLLLPSPAGTLTDETPMPAAASDASAAAR